MPWCHEHCGRRKKEAVADAGSLRDVVHLAGKSVVTCCKFLFLSAMYRLKTSMSGNDQCIEKDQAAIVVVGLKC